MSSLEISICNATSLAPFMSTWCLARNFSNPVSSVSSFSPNNDSLLSELTLPIGTLSHPPCLALLADGDDIAEVWGGCVDFAGSCAPKDLLVTAEMVLVHCYPSATQSCEVVQDSGGLALSGSLSQRLP